MKRVVAFFALAYTLTWVGWLPLVASALGWTARAPTPYLHLFATLGPAVAALVMAASEGRGALRRFVARFAFAPWRWMVLAVAAPALLYAIAAALLIAFGADVDIAATGRSAEYPQLGMGTYAIANIVFYGFGEEVGWRGYALPRLQARMSATRASLVIVVGWALWHLPLFAFAGMSSMGPAEIVGWIASLVAGSFLMTFWLNASGSIIAVALFHGVLDVLINSPTGGPLQSTMGALVTILGLTLPFRFGRAHLAPRPREVDPA